MNRIRTELLEDETQRFHDLITAYPGCAPFWDVVKMDLNVSKFNAAIPSMAHGEQIMAQFIISLWTGLNGGRFDVFDAAATLDDKERISEKCGMYKANLKISIEIISNSINKMDSVDI